MGQSGSSSSGLSVVQPLASAFASTPRKLSSLPMSPQPVDPFASYLRQPDASSASTDAVAVVNPSTQLSFTLMHNATPPMSVLTVTNKSNCHIVFRVQPALYSSRAAVAIRLAPAACNQLLMNGTLDADDFIVEVVLLIAPPSPALVAELRTVDLWPQVPAQYRHVPHRVAARFSTWTPNANDL
ncbi:hypothetical protein AC1031_009528 [Aphanomyces cochlioides]|nr:hypothetical protein AC1031_009528 [Aphanomyces cochlioides]